MGPRRQAPDPGIFHADFTFRGSLGPTLVGHAQFAGDVDWVTEAFGQYTSDILSMIEEDNRVSPARCGFTASIAGNCSACRQAAGMSGGPGMPIFTFEGSKVRDLYVLGDIHGLIARLKD